MTVRVVLPHNLTTMASAGKEVQLEVAAPVTQRVPSTTLGSTR